MITKTTRRPENGIKTGYENENMQYGYGLGPRLVRFIAIFRICCLGICIGTILYATYQVYLATREYTPWQWDPIRNHGPFSRFLGRGRDTTDYEWVNYIRFLMTKLSFWFSSYVFLKIFFTTTLSDWKLYEQLLAAFGLNCQQVWCSLSISFSWFFLQSLIGTLGALFLFLQPLLLYFLARQTQSKSVIWIVSLVFLSFLTVPWYRAFVFSDEADWYFSTASAWCYSRCISFCFDTWDVKTVGHKKSLFNMISYCFYFPLIVTGPLILYSQFEANIVQSYRNPRRKDGKTLLKDLARMAFWIIVAELLIHFLYFRPLSLTLPAFQKVNLWVICGLVYWLGQFFMLKYVIMYGVSTSIAKFDGVEMPPLPRCISYIHRYTLLWKDFDRGLYNFLVQYTYKPTLRKLESLDQGKKINPEFRKLIALFSTYVFVYIWHSVYYEMLVWSALNFIGVSIERFGSFVKRSIELQVEKEIILQQNRNRYTKLSNRFYFMLLHPLFWDFIVEPIVSIPLAVMSILNSQVFCGSLTAAILSTDRILNDANFYTLFFVYCFTHVAVGIRTWKEWWPSFKLSLENNVSYPANIHIPSNCVFVHSIKLLESAYDETLN